MNVVITGSSSGIGAGLARFLAHEKHNILVTYNQSSQKAKKVFQDIKNIYPQGNHILGKLDVLDENSLHNLFTKTQSTWESIDLLIVNAGNDYNAPLEESSFDDWHAIFHTKADGAYLTTKHFLPLLKNAGTAQIVYISASVGWKPDATDPAYSSACAAVTNFSQSMAIALSPFGIRSNTICPGPIQTDLQYWKEAIAQHPSLWDDMAKTNPLKRLCTVEDIGNAIQFLASKGTYLNGNIFYLNGGAHLR